MDCSPAGSSVGPWDFPGKSTGVIEDEFKKDICSIHPTEVYLMLIIYQSLFTQKKARPISYSQKNVKEQVKMQRITSFFLWVLLPFSLCLTLQQII